MMPVLHVFGRDFSSYSLCCALALLSALIMSLILSKKLNVKPYKTLSLLIVCAVCGFAGAFLLYIPVTYSPRGLVTALRDGTFTGGLVYYGGFILAAAGALLFCRAMRWDSGRLSAVIVPCLPLAHAIGRVGCFLAGCCYGRASDGFLSVMLPDLGIRVLPVQLFEAAGELVIFVILLMTLKKTGALKRYILLYAPLRFALEFLRGDAIRGGFLWFSTSQWLSLILVLSVMFCEHVKKARSY